MVGKTDSVQMAVRIPRQLREAALAKARREDLTLSQVVRRLLREWLAEDPSAEGDIPSNVE